ncbi:MAG: hypothetical protein ACETV0_05675 [Nitrososphaeria archaeon]
MAGAPPSTDGKPERPYGKAPIIALALFATWNLYGILKEIPVTVDIHVTIEEVVSMGPPFSPEFLAALPALRLFVVFGVIYTAAWFVILALQYAFAYGLWRPKRWVRKVGMVSLGLGLIVSIARLLATIAFSAALQLDVNKLVGSDILVIILNGVAFSAGRRFLNKPEVGDYLEAEGYGYAEPTPFVVEEEMEPQPTPFEEAEVRIPDRIRERRPISVAWIAEERSVGEIFLDGDHLFIVKSPSREVIDIPIEDVVELERGEMGFYGRDMTTVSLALHALDLSYYGKLMVSKLKITYSTKPGVTSAVTLVEERRICPQCGGKMSLVAAGWYCMKDDFLIDPATNDVVQMIESRRSAKTSKKDVIDRPVEGGPAGT